MKYPIGSMGLVYLPRLIIKDQQIVDPLTHPVFSHPKSPSDQASSVRPSKEQQEKSYEGEFH